MVASDEFCVWYDVVKQSWRPGSQDGADSRWPRIGELVGRSATNGTLCDGYGSRQFGERTVRIPCAQCPGDPYKRDTWSVLQCSRTPLVPISQRISPAWRPLSVLGSAPRGVLLVVSDHNNHGLFAQVERVLNQLHLAAERGLTPHVFLGHKVFNAPDACDVGENQYYERGRGPNVWDYYFEPVSEYTTGAATLGGRPVRLFSASVEDARRYAIRTAGDAVTSYFEFKRYSEESAHAIRTPRCGRLFFHLQL